MNYEIVELEDMTLEGLVLKTTNENGKAMEDIANLWQSFFSNNMYQKIQNKVNEKIIGMYADFEGDYTKPYNFYVGAQVSKKSDNVNGLVTKVIEKGRYAKFLICGDIQKDVAIFWSKLWEMNLDRKYSTDFEEYQNNSEDFKNQEIHIYISLN